jgi:hypothetical protein
MSKVHGFSFGPRFVHVNDRHLGDAALEQQGVEGGGTDSTRADH